MAEIRLTVDPSQPLAALRQVGDEMRKLSAVAAELRRASAAALGSGPTGASGAAAQHEQTTRAIEQQAKATQQLGQTQATQAAIADRVLRSRREEAGLVQRIIDGLGSQDAATRKAAQSTATFLSTLGGASRAASQYAVAMSRIERALAAGLVTESQANLLREKTARTFTTANINAKDLRLNMHGLNQSFQVLASVVSRFDPILGATVSTMLRAGIAAGKLSGGFSLLGPIGALLGVVAAGFTALAVAGDRTDRIPGQVSRIWEGLKELAAQAAEATGATQALYDILQKVGNLLPVKQTPVQAARQNVEDINAQIKARQDQTTFQRFATRLDPNAQTDANLEQNRLRAEADLTAALAVAKRDLITTIDKEAAAHVALVEKRRKVIESYNQEVLGQKGSIEALKERDRLLAVIDKEEAQRVAGLRENRDAQREANEEAKKAAEIAKAYADAIAGLRVEEEQATVNEQRRLEDLKANNDLLQQEIEATKQGTEALKAFNLEKARTLEIDRQRKAGVDDPAAVAEAERAEFLRQQLSDAQRSVTDQQKVSDQTEKIWINTISNLESQWSELWANLLSGSDKTFKDITSNIKGLFTSLLGNLISGSFAPFFNQLRQGISGATGGGGGTGAGAGFANPLSALSAFRDSVSGGVSDAFRKLGLTIGGAFGSQNAVGIGNIFGTVGSGLAGAGAGFGISQLVLAGVLSERRQKEHQTGILIGAGSGALLGAIVGSIVPGIGTAIGAAVGAIVGGLVGAFASKGAGSTALQIRTLRQDTFVRPDQTVPRPERPRNTFLVGQPVESPFGFLGAIGAGTGGGTNAGDRQRILRSVARFDAELNKHLTAQQTELVAATAFISQDEKFSNTRDTLKVFKKRATEVLTALSVPLDTAIDVFNAVDPKLGAAGVAEAFGSLLEGRQATLDLIADLRGLAPPANDAVEALDKLNQNINQLRLTAPDLGIQIEDFAGLRAAALKRFTDDFNKNIADSLLEIENPGALLVRAEQEAAEKRLREAITAGADLVQVEKLNAERRKLVLEEANRSILDVIRAINLSPSGSSPTAALGGAETRFFSLVNTPGSSRDDIAAAAQNFLNLGEQFLGGPTFAAKRDLVLSTLESLLNTFPTTAADTGEQITDLNLETARGNAANEQLLAQLIDETSSMRNEIVLLNTKLERALAK